jgi:hypothetical protein
LAVSGRGSRAWGRHGVAAWAGDTTPILVALLTAGVFLLRLSQIHQSLYGDEVWSYQDIAGHSLLSVISTVHTGAENSPPLFFVLAWASAKLGDPTIWIRLPSLILGTATIPLIYLLGRETVGRTAGLIGAAVLAFSPFSIYYGIEARPYATMAFLLTLSTLALVRAVRTGSRAWWLVYVLAAAAAAYTHYTAVFVLATQGAWSVWACRDRVREPLMAGALIAVLYVPWLPHVRGKSLGVIGFLEPLNAHNVLTDLGRVIPGYPYASLRAIPAIWGLIVIAVCCAVGALAIAGRDAERAGRLVAAQHLPLLIALALATPVGLLLYSMIGTDLWLARGLYASVPAATLVIGALLGAPPPRVRAVVVAAVLLTLVAGTIRAVSPSYARPPFRSVAGYLDRVAGPRDPIIMYPSFVDQAIPAQFSKPHRVLNISPSAWRSAGDAATAFAIVDDQTAQVYNVGTPRPPGFELVARKHYTGLVWFTVLSYRARRPALSSSHTRSRSRTA